MPVPDRLCMGCFSCVGVCGMTDLVKRLRDNQNKFAALCLNHSEDSIQYRILSRSAKLAAELVTKYAPKENG